MRLRQPASLKTRLLLIIGITLALLWAAAAVLMLRDLDHAFQDTLDGRLAMSARMVAGLVGDSIAIKDTAAQASATPSPLPARRGLACQVRSLGGAVLATTDAAPDLSGQARTGHETRRIDGVDWRVYTLHAGAITVTTADRIDERDALKGRMLLAAVVPFAVAAAGGLLALWLGVGQGLVPLDRLRVTLAQRRPDDSDPVSIGNAPTELTPLLSTLNKLLARVGHAVQRERHFTDDAAHELRTPLTAIDTQLQLARRSQGKQREDALDDATRGVRRLQATLEQLLLLARVEGALPFDEAESIDVTTAIQQASAHLDDSSIQRLQLHATRDTRDMRVAAAPALVVAALRNLVDNALQHSSAGSDVDIHVQHSGAQLQFIVRDQGDGFGAQVERADERFWRGTHGKDGSGLGLAIVAAIAQRYAGTLDLGDSPHGGASATLCLPTVRHSATPTDRPAVQ